MLIGIPREIKDHEFRIGVTPPGVLALTRAGHEVWVQTGAGARAGFSDEAYSAAGARICSGAKEIYTCPLVVKVKEPQAVETEMLYEGQVLFCYLHLAPNPVLTAALLKQKAIGIAYETVIDAAGSTPLLAPMSEVAGRLAAQAGANALTMINGGNGTLLGGVPGVPPGKVVIIGGGTVGTNAAKIALGMGADVTLLDVNATRLRWLDDVYGPRLKTCHSTAETIDQQVREADLAIGSVYVEGKRAPKLISRATVGSMRPGSALVDVAIDQGGCAETSRPTTHSSPTYVEEGVVHYCVTNMPAACSRTSTQALTNATLPYILALCSKGYRQAMLDDPGLRHGLNVHAGQVTHHSVAEDLGYDYVRPEDVFGQ